MDTQQTKSSLMQIENRVTVPITPQLRSRLLREKSQYKKLKAKFSKEFDSSPETEYYLISVRFIEQWKQFTNYNENDLQSFNSHGVQPKNFNHNLIKQYIDGQIQLLPDLMQNQDYYIVNKPIMDIFNFYIGIIIKRNAYKLINGEKRVAIYNIKIKYFFLTQKICYSIDMGKEKTRQFDIKILPISKYASCSDMKKLSASIYEQKQRQSKLSEDIRIWKVNPEMTKTKYFSHVQSTVKKQPINNYSIMPLATIFDKQQQTIQQFGITQQDLIIFQIRNNKRWTLKYGDIEQSCEYCRSYKILKIACGCKQVKYCTEECKYKDIKFHKRNCRISEQEELNQVILYEFTPLSKKGLTGLSNLGNTCFMNSCLQCLSNTENLTKYFINKTYVNQINKTNPIGTKGKLTIKFAKLIQALWCKEQSSYSPENLKYAIGEFQPMFAGYNQHDSQQLLSFLLDGLHQDLNKILSKPYVQSIDSNGRPDQVVAKQSWENYLKRNKSIIVDLFMGQYKSRVMCPDCNFQSITFDPFSNVSLPIPHTSKQSIDAFVFYQNYTQTPKKITIEYKTPSVTEWIAFTANLLRLDIRKLKFYILSFDGEIQQITQKTTISEVKDKIDRQNRHLFCIQCTDQQKKIDIQRKIRFDFKFVKVSNRESVTFKRPFYFDIKKDAIRGEQIYERIFKHIYKPVISRAYKQNSDASNDYIRKLFEKLFESKQKYPYEIYLMTNKSSKNLKSSVNFQKQRLILLKDNLKEYIYSNDQIKQFEFQVRITQRIKEQIKKLNTYEDHNKFRRKNQDEDDHKDCQFIDCLKQFQKREKLQKGNEWYCSKCKQHKQAFKEMSIYKTSKILVFHLKRFKQKSTYFKSKLTSLVKYPLILDLKQFLLNHTLPEAYFENGNTSQSSKYQLYAVSNHFGGMGGGHYTAYAKNGNNWYNFDDSSVRPMSQNDVVSPAGYLLFYKRI